MPLRFLCLLLALCATTIALHAQPYNQLWIPDTLSGTEFHISLNHATKQFRSGPATNTYGFNSANYLGPTLIMRKGDAVRLDVTNNLMDTATVHWHGFHIPAVMDGGPHQPIAPGETWRPEFTMMNNAGTYWYHPHLHMMTEEQMMMGLGGMIIIRDDAEAALALPRTYGVDDIPLILQDRRFGTDNQFVKDTYGDTMLVNGTPSASMTAPAQVVRFRILNAAAERAYNIGFSDNRAFRVIGTDGGLLGAPVTVTRKVLGVGERIEILVDFSGQNGGSVEMMSYNAGQPMGYPGGEPQSTGAFGSALNNRNFRMLHIDVGAPTAAPVTAIPSVLVPMTALDTNAVDVVRHVKLTEGFNRSPFRFDSTTFEMDVINKVVRRQDVEVWELKNISAFSHTFHIHDVQFRILTRNGAAPKAEEQGWKDVALVNMNETVRFIARFDDFADSVHPYMYHCHIGFHEDEGMMGQFVVVERSSGVTDAAPVTDGAMLAPNPATGLVRVSGAGAAVIGVRIVDMLGATAAILSGEDIRDFDVSALPSGVYTVRTTDRNGVLRTHRLIRN